MLIIFVGMKNKYLNQPYPKIKNTADKKDLYLLVRFLSYFKLASKQQLYEALHWKSGVYVYYNRFRHFLRYNNVFQ